MGIAIFLTVNIDALVNNKTVSNTSIFCSCRTFIVNYTASLLGSLSSSSKNWPKPQTALTFSIGNSSHSKVIYQEISSYEISNRIIEIPFYKLKELTDLGEDVVFFVSAEHWVSGMIYYPFGRSSSKCSSGVLTLTKNGGQIISNKPTFYGEGLKQLANFGHDSSVYKPENELIFNVNLIFNNNPDPR